MGKLLAISVGAPREVEWHGRQVRTSIFKTPIEGRVRVGRLNIAGDQQSDLSVHGGQDKAVYVYPSEHYPAWRRELPDPDLNFGAFGENLTTDGLLEPEVGIGDRLRIGTAEFMVTQPRMPCYKLGVRFDDPQMVKRFHHAGRNGFYLAVIQEGEIGAGDTIELVARDGGGLTVADVVSLYAGDGNGADRAGNGDKAVLERAIRHPALPVSWRDYFRNRL